MVYLYIKIQAFFAILCQIIICLCSSTVLRIKDGQISGTTSQTINKRTVHTFKGIPYGQPPLGDLRFRDPLPAKPWSGVRNATHDCTACYQRENLNTAAPFELTGSEDCLCLSVYTPSIQCKKNKLLPVMVYIYGGSWVQGTNEESFYGPEFLLVKDVLLVTFNYRVDVFGFLSTGDDHAPGNFGLKDQVLALKWVQHNIEYFCGDPSQVTIFGGSIGGASVRFHYFSPRSQGLFKQGISMTGTALVPAGLHKLDVVVNGTKQLAEAVGCPESPSAALLACMRKKPASSLIEAQEQLHPTGFPPFVIKVWAAVDDSKISKNSFFISNVRTTSFDPSIPWLDGFAANDGAFYACLIYDFPEFEKGIETDPYYYLPRHLQLESLFPPKNFHDVLNRTLQFYFKGQPISRSTRPQLVTMFTDFVFSTTSRRAAFRNKIPVRYYLYDYRLPQTFNDLFGFRGSVPETPGHYDDLLTLFPVPKYFENRTYTDTDMKVITRHVDLWTNFAKTGDPTHGDKSLKWDTIGTDEDFRYLYMGSEFEMRKNPRQESYEFWQTLLREYGSEN